MDPAANFHVHRTLGPGPIFALGVALFLCGCAGTPIPQADVLHWRQYALMQTLNAELLASRSATATLRDWCARHGLAPMPDIVAEVLPDDVPASTEQRARLGVTPDEPIRYRRVRLRCGTHVMSEAENWYVPGRLTADMNRQLDASQTPFGRAIESLQPYRRTFHAQVLWLLPPGDAPPGDVPALLFEHRAVVYSAAHAPLAEVRETYQRTALP